MQNITKYSNNVEDVIFSCCKLEQKKYSAYITDAA